MGTRCRAAAPLVVLVAPLLFPSAAYAAGEPLVLTPNPLDFGTVVMTTTKTLSVSAMNNARSGTLRITSVRLERPSSSGFRVARDGCTGAILATGASCAVEVEFAPTAPSTYASLAFGAAGVTVSAEVSGHGVPAATSTSTPTTSTPTTALAPPVTTTVPVTTTAATAPPVTAPPTTTTVPRSDEERLSECERLAQDATVSYANKRTMVAGRTEEVEVTASIGDAARSVVVTTPVSTTIVVAALQCEVQAQLRGVGFTIEPEAFQLGSFIKDPVIRWSWQVVPLESGRRALIIEVRSVVVIGGRKIEGAGVELLRTDIDVFAEPESAGEKLERWTGAVVKHPLVQGLGSLLLVIGTLTGWWRWLLKRPWNWTKRPVPAESPAPAPPRDPVAAGRP